MPDRKWHESAAATMNTVLLDRAVLEVDTDESLNILLGIKASSKDRCSRAEWWQRFKIHSRRCIEASGTQPHSSVRIPSETHEVVDPTDEAADIVELS